MAKQARPTRIIWTLTLCTGLSLLGDSTMYAVLPSQYAVLGLLSLQVGWMLSVNRLVRIPLNLVSGWLTDRIGGRAPYIVGLAIGACSTMGYGLTNNVWLLLLLRALWGVAWALLVVAALRMVLDVTGDGSRGRWIGLYISGSFLAGALGAVLGGILTDGLGFSLAMRILGGITWLGFLGALTLPARETGRRRTATTDALPASRWTRSSWRVWWGWRQRFGSRVLAISMLNFAHRFLFAGVLAGTLGLYLRELVGEEVVLGPAIVGVASLTSALMFMQNVVAVMTGPAAGHLSDRIGDRSRVLLLGETVGVSALVCLALGHSFAAVAAGVVLAATAVGIVPPMVMSWMGDLSRAEHHGSTVGLYQTLGDLGSGLGPLAAYLLLEPLGIRWVYGASALALALTIPLILRLRRRPQVARA